jgi:hypothetical protein
MVPTAKARARATARYRMVRPPLSAITWQSEAGRAGWQMVSQRRPGPHRGRRLRQAAAARPPTLRSAVLLSNGAGQRRGRAPSRSRRRELPDRGCCRPVLSVCIHGPKQACSPAPVPGGLRRSRGRARQYDAQPAGPYWRPAFAATGCAWLSARIPAVGWGTGGPGSSCLLTVSHFPTPAVRVSLAVHG